MLNLSLNTKKGVIMSEQQIIERRIAKDRDSSIFYFDMYANSEILKAKKFSKYKKGENIIVEEYETSIKKEEAFNFINNEGYFEYSPCKTYKLVKTVFDSDSLITNYIVENVTENYKNIKALVVLVVEFEEVINDKKFVYRIERESNRKTPKCYISYYHNTTYKEAEEILSAKSDFNCLNYRLQFSTKISEEIFNRINSESSLCQVDIGTVYTNTIFNSKGKEYRIIPIDKLRDIDDKDLWSRYFIKQDINFGDMEDYFFTRTEYITKLLEKSGNYYSCLECTSWSDNAPLNKINEKKFVSLTYCSNHSLVKIYKYEDSDDIILNISSFFEEKELNRGKRKFERLINQLELTPAKFKIERG